MKDLSKKFSKFFKNFCPYLVIAFVVSLFFWKFFIKGQIPIPGDFVVGVYYPWLDYKWQGFPFGVPVKNPITTDVVSLIYPEQMLAVEQLKSGQLPLWNPYILSGTPLFANLQAAPFSPTNFVYWIFDKLRGWGLQIILQHFLVALFTFILLRYWKLSKLASFFAGIAFAFSGFNLIFSQWNGHTLSAAFIPLSLYFTDRLIKEGKFFYIGGLAISLTLQLLSGYPQVSLYTGLAIALLLLVRFFEDRRNVLTKIPLFLLAGVFTLGLSAFQLFPTLELWNLSQRSFEPHPFEWAFLPWKKIITFVAPDFFGNHATGNYWGPQDYTSNTAYVGVVVFILGLAAFNLIKKNKIVLYLIILAFFSLLISFPTPVSVWLWQNNVLGMRAASAHRATILFDFAFCALAAWGLDYLYFAKKVKVKFSLLSVYLLIGSFGAISLYLYLATRASPEALGAVVRGIPKYTVALRNLFYPTIILLLVSFIVISKKFKILILPLMVLELFRFGWKYTPFSPAHIVFPATPILQFLQSQTKPFRVTGNRVIPVNMRTPYNLESPEGYETIHPLRVSQFLAALNSGNVGTTPVGRYGTVDNDISPLLDLANTKYYLVLKFNSRGQPDPKGEIPSRFNNDRFKLVFEDGSVAIIESKSALPRAFMVYDWEVVKNDNEILTKLLSKDFPYGKKIILEESPFVKTSGDKSLSTIGFIKYLEQESEIKVETDKDGLLLISDAYYPGWKAKMDGIETKIYRADYMFRAVEVPKGNHTLKFKYEPKSFKEGLIISEISLFLVISVFVFKREIS